MADTSFEHGLGVGKFPQLSLTHVIRASRLTEDYLVRLAEGREASIAFMSTPRGERVSHPLSDHWVKRWWKWLRLPFLPRIDRRITRATLRGQRKGFAIVRELGLPTDGSLTPAQPA